MKLRDITYIKHGDAVYLSCRSEHAYSHLLSTLMLLCLVILSCTLLAVLNKSLISLACYLVRA